MAQDVLSDAPVLSTWTALPPGPVLDPLERISEILFGVIMVLTFTSSISVAEGGHAETREVLVAALGCNIAWGIVDAAFYLMSSVIGRARGLRILRAIRENRDQSLSHRLILDGASRSGLGGADSLGGRRASRTAGATTRPAGALGVRIAGTSPAHSPSSCWCSSRRFPISLPFLLFPGAGFAMRASNAVAIAMLFGMGWTLGNAHRHDRAGGPGSPWSASDWYSSRSRSRWADESAGFLSTFVTALTASTTLVGGR